MKQLLTTTLISIITLTLMAQQQETFIYEITLYEQYKHQATWTERERGIQQEHIAYLDSLTKAGSLQVAGIADQGLESHIGLIILTTKNYEEAKTIALNDPSVKEGMMSVCIRPFNIYFKEN